MKNLIGENHLRTERIPLYKLMCPFIYRSTDFLIFSSFRYTSASSHAKNDLRVKWRARSLKYAKNLIRLQTNVKSRVLEKGEVVYNEGDEGTSMYSVDDHEGGK